MQNSVYIKIQEDFQSSHYFIYKGKKYPINFELFKCSSKFFFDNQAVIYRSEVIPLADDSNLVLTDESITNFIKYVHRETIPLNNENAVPLSYLARKYEVNSLIKITDEYIRAHHQELALQILTIHQNVPDFDTSAYEDALSDNFVFYAENEELFALNIQILHRILTRYFHKKEQNHKNDNDEMKKVVRFLFRCLDRFGRNASVLFSDIDIREAEIGCLNRLLTDYSEVFDFNFLNSTVLKSVYETQSLMIRKIEQNKKDEEEKIEKMKEEQINFLKSEISLMREQMRQIEIDHENQMRSYLAKEDEEKNLLKNEIKQLKEEISLVKKSLKQILLQQKQKDEEDKNALINETKMLKEEINFIKEQYDQIFYLMIKKYNITNLDDLCNKYNQFNDLDGEIQAALLREINSKFENSEIEKVIKLLEFLSNEMKNSKERSNYVFIQCINKQSKQSNEMIFGLNHNVTNALFEHSKASSEEFAGLIDGFSEFYIEIKYPQQNFDDIYNKVIKVKQSQSKIKIALFISGINETDFKFQHNKYIGSVRMDSKVQIINGYKENKWGSFYDCPLLKYVSIPKSVATIGNCAFQKCSSLAQISIPSSVSFIGECAFEECTSLNEITIPPSVTSIEEYAFNECSSLQRISIPSSVTKIGKCAFTRCTSLKQVLIPSSVSSIGDNAFGGCSSLIQITIPSFLNSRNLGIMHNTKVVEI